MMKVKVYKAAPTVISTWAFLTMGRSDDRVEANVKKFGEFMRDNMGIAITASPANKYRADGKREEDLRMAFQWLVKNTPRLQFVLVVLPFRETSTYHAVKRLGDVEFGIPTVCVRQEKIIEQRGQLGYFANVGLKVNLKFGGVNHRVNDSTGLVKNTMFVGYDVTHPTNLPAGAADKAPSFVGLVASCEEDLAQWPAVTWATKGGVENVGKGEDKGQKFVENFKDRIRLWQKHSKGRPLKNIVIFRDGVSEGQFKMVLADELPHIREACRQMCPANDQPRLSVIVSVKRHQTRFYPTNAEHMSRSRSPKEGTIVDRGVTNVRYWDFFLQAHASIQGKPSHAFRRYVIARLTKSTTGTARPAHYTVLLDEIFRAQFGHKAADVLEKLTHDMCYAYGRATKAVSICPPAYYADLVAARARIHKGELFDDTGSVSSNQMSSNRQDQIANRTVHPNLKDTMYYI
jgi:hypothetical protein